MKANKNIDEITKKIMQDLPLESPSVNFVDMVMRQIEAASQKSSEIVYKPLISKKAWFFILLITLGAALYTLFFVPELSIPVNLVDLSFFENWQLPTIFEGIEISNLFALSFIFFAIVVIFQMVFINRYFNKQNLFTTS